MKKIIESVTTKRSQTTNRSKQSTAVECNYQNNYYGDKTCVTHSKVEEK